LLASWVTTRGLADAPCGWIQVEARRAANLAAAHRSAEPCLQRSSLEMYTGFALGGQLVMGTYTERVLCAALFARRRRTYCCCGGRSNGGGKAWVRDMDLCREPQPAKELAPTSREVSGFIASVPAAMRVPQAELGNSWPQWCENAPEHSR